MNRMISQFLQAIPSLLKKDPELTFLIGGDGELSPYIQSYIKDNKLEHKIQFTGWIDRENLPDYLNELTLLVIPSSTEGLPNLMLEAMACGTPVISTPVGAIPDIITNEETGFIIKQNTSNQIEQGILHAIDHPRLQSISSEGKKLINNKFYLNHSTKQMDKILHNI